MAIVPLTTKQGISAYLKSAFTYGKYAKEFVDIYFESSLDSKVSNEIVVGANEHEIISFDNQKLKAYEIKANDKNKFIIIVCDYRQEVNEMTNFVREFNIEGYNNIVIPQRLDPNFISKGVYDLSLWLSYFKDIYPDIEIVLYGEGYGANTIVKYLQTEVMDNIKTCILDDLKPLDIKEKINEYVVLKNLSNKTMMYKKVKQVLMNRYDIKLDDLSLNKIIKNNKTPLCFIYNKEKENYKDVLKIYNSTLGEKKFFFINVKDRNQNQNNYFETLKKYLTNY